MARKYTFFRPCSVIFHKGRDDASYSCVPLARCPRASSAHPTLWPNGLMWGYWDNVPLARGCRNTLSSYISQAKVTQNWHMSRVSSDFIGVTSDLHRTYIGRTSELDRRKTNYCVSTTDTGHSKYSNASIMSKYTPSKPAARMRLR